MDQLVSRQHDQDGQTILDWLTSTEYGAQQSDILSRRQEGTGQGLLDSTEFKSWCDGWGYTVLPWNAWSRQDNHGFYRHRVSS